MGKATNKTTDNTATTPKQTSKMADFARNLTILSPLMTNRDKLETKDVIGEELTLTEYDIVNSGKNTYGVCVFAEYPDKFLFAGTVLTDLLCSLQQEFGDEGRADLKENGLKLKLSTQTAKKANDSGMKSNYTAVEIL
jgi:hypothetical protein